MGVAEVVAGHEGLLSALSRTPDKAVPKETAARAVVHMVASTRTDRPLAPKTLKGAARLSASDARIEWRLEKRPDITSVPRPGNHLIIVAMAETGLIIDTYEDIQELVRSGMPEPQAETVVRQRVRLLEGNLATKADIEKLRLETEKLIALSKADIIKWVVGANMGIAAVIVAVIKLL